MSSFWPAGAWKTTSSRSVPARDLGGGPLGAVRDRLDPYRLLGQPQPGQPVPGRLHHHDVVVDEHRVRTAPADRWPAW